MLVPGPASARGRDNASGPSAASVPAWTVCKAEGAPVRTGRGFRQTFYLSGVVPSTNDPDVGKAFALFIEQKYLGKKMHSPCECWSARSQAEAQDSIKKKVDSSRWNIEYVATSWTNTPASPATDTTSQGQNSESP
jgi:hypothetical protein